MKNIIKVALLFLLVGGAVSCNLDKYPSDAVPADEGLLSYRDAKEFRNGLYNFTRSCFSSYTVIPVNIQGEGINATKDYGNQYGFQYTWNFRNDDDVVGNLWTNCYAAIYQINYFLEKVEALDLTKMEEKERLLIDLYKAEAHFFRAMINNQLATFYCKDYDPSTAQNDLGIIITDKADISARKERSSLYKTYEWINEDIVYAKTALIPFEPNYTIIDPDDSNKRITPLSATLLPTEPYYIRHSTVTALETKVLFNMHEYETAAKLAEKLVTEYPLISNKDDFENLWKNDTGSEIIFQFYASLNEGRSAYGSMFLYDPKTTGIYDPFYIPSQWMLDQYAFGDIRLQTYFRRTNVRIGSTSYFLSVVTKYPGNPKYSTNPAYSELMQNVRPYRSADFALIAAEAYALAGDNGKANECLKNLLTARIITSPTYQYQQISSNEELLEVVKNERLKEMFMEGNRIADLKRWGEGMNRIGQDSQNDNAVVPEGVYLNIPADDKRFIWPIPQSESSSNPNVQPNW